MPVVTLLWVLKGTRGFNQLLTLLQRVETLPNMSTKYQKYLENYKKTYIFLLLLWHHLLVTFLALKNTRICFTVVEIGCKPVLFQKYFFIDFDLVLLSYLVSSISPQTNFILFVVYYYHLTVGHVWYLNCPAWPKCQACQEFEYLAKVQEFFC